MALTWKTVKDIQEKLIVALAESLNGSTVREKISIALDAWQDVVEAYKNDDYYGQFLTQSLHKTIKSSTVYSDSFDEMIQKDFTYKGNKYTWNDIDCVYYNNNGDEEDFFMEIPEGAITSSKKPVKGMTKPEGEILREVEDDVGCLIQLVKLTNGKYLVTDNWQTEDICDNLKEANIKFNEYFM